MNLSQACHHWAANSFSWSRTYPPASDHVFIVKLKYSRRHITLKYDELFLGVTEKIPYQYVKTQTVYFNLYTLQEGKEKNLFGTERN